MNLTLSAYLFWWRNQTLRKICDCPHKQQLCVLFSLRGCLVAQNVLCDIAALATFLPVLEATRTGNFAGWWHHIPFVLLEIIKGKPNGRDVVGFSNHLFSS